MWFCYGCDGNQFAEDPRHPLEVAYNNKWSSHGEIPENEGVGFISLPTTTFGVYLRLNNWVLLKEAVRPSGKFAHFTQNFIGNSMVGIIFVKNVRLRNGGHFKIEPPKSGGAICDQTASLIKKWKKIDPHYLFNFGGGLFSSLFLLDSPFGHKLNFKIEPPQCWGSMG